MEFSVIYFAGGDSNAVTTLKAIQMSDPHQCNNHEVGLANLIKLQIGKEEKKYYYWIQLLVCVFSVSNSQNKNNKLSIKDAEYNPIIAYS